MLAVENEKTPLVELILPLRAGHRIFAKDEMNHPTSSMKDRMIPFVLDRMTEANKVRSGMTIIEASSGNTGAALAYEGTKRGLKVVIFLSSSIAKEKVKLIQELGAETVLVDTSEKPGAEIFAAEQRAQEPDSVYFNQFENPFHVEAYRRTIAHELISQLEDQELKIDSFIVGIGSGASAIAIGEELKKSHNPNIAIHAVSPSQRPSDIEGLHPGHLIPQGHFKIWRDRPENFEVCSHTVKDEDAMYALLELEEKMGIRVGPASGAVFSVAKLIETAGNHLIILSDSGEKYLEKIETWRTKLANQ